jgi:hypothetical protein
MTATIHAYSLNLRCREIGRKAQQCAVKGSLRTWGGDDRDVNDELVQFWVTKTCWRAVRRADIPHVLAPQPAAPQVATVPQGRGSPVNDHANPLSDSVPPGCEHTGPRPAYCPWRQLSRHPRRTLRRGIPTAVSPLIHSAGIRSQEEGVAPASLRWITMVAFVFASWFFKWSPNGGRVRRVV